jgi:hypothetical protein
VPGEAPSLLVLFLAKLAGRRQVPAEGGRSAPFTVAAGLLAGCGEVGEEAGEVGPADPRALVGCKGER